MSEWAVSATQLADAMTKSHDEAVERAARAIAHAMMSRNMQQAPAKTQALYIDAIWRDYVGAAQAVLSQV